MSRYIWRKINVGFGKETTRWTAVAPAIRCPKSTMEFDEKSEKVIDESSIGVIEDSFDGHVSKQRAEGSLECNVYANVIWYVLLNIFGSVATTSSGGAYSHAFSVAENNQHQSLTIWIADDTQDKQFPLAMINTVEIGAEVGDFVKANIEFRSKKGANASLTPTYSTDYAMLWKHVKVYFADNLAWLNSATAVNATNFTLTINKNIEDVDVLWSVEPNDFCNTQFTVEWNVELLRDDETYQALYKDWTKKAMRIQIIDGNDTIWTASNPTLTFDLASVIMTEFAKTQDNDALIRQGIDFKALYSMSDAKMINATLLNTKSSY